VIGLLIKKVFGTKHERDLRVIRPIADRINEIYGDLERLSDALLRNPEAWTVLRGHPERADQAVEELLRYDTPVQMTTKWAAADIPFHDRVIRKDDTVIFFWGAVNRDPARYTDPDRLDLDRRDIGHHSFGMGAHFCLGASLAVMPGLL